MSPAGAAAGPLKSALAFAPASVGNVAIGFDILGFSVDALGDRARVRRLESPEVRIEAIHGVVRDLPLATLNIKDFSDFADHDGLRIVGVNER